MGNNMLLIIDNYDSFTYNLYQVFARFHQEITVMRNDKISIQDIARMKPQGIILSPGPGRPEDAGICIDLIRAIVHAKINVIPLLGVCLGHQAITIALGGRVVQAQEICHGKEDLIYHRKNGLYRRMSVPFKAGRYHSLIAERESLPKTLRVDSENKQKIIMGLRHYQLPIYGVQFHPESILTPEGELLLEEFTTICHRKLDAKGGTA
mgnify:CR=1 FL=1